MKYLFPPSILTNKYARCFLLALGLLTLGQFLFIPSAHAATKSAAWLTANVPNAQNTVTGWETTCSKTLSANRARGLTGRTLVDSAAYIDSVWLSQAGD